MHPSLAFTIFAFLIFTSLTNSFPDSPNPNLEYELINNVGGPQVYIKPMTTTTHPFVMNTPPPPNPNSKTFQYDPVSKSWNLVKKTDPPPKEDTLLWNQSNDKFLT